MGSIFDFGLWGREVKTCEYPDCELTIPVTRDFCYRHGRQYRQHSPPFSYEKIEKKSSATCVKCGSNDLNYSYSTGKDDCPFNRRNSEYPNGVNPCKSIKKSQEHLEVTCRNCQFMWNEDTKDSKPDDGYFKRRDPGDDYRIYFEGGWIDENTPS